MKRLMLIVLAVVLLLAAAAWPYWCHYGIYPAVKDPSPRADETINSWTIMLMVIVEMALFAGGVVLMAMNAGPKRTDGGAA